MIKLISELPRFKIESVQAFKIKSDYEIYSDTTRLYKSEDGGIISVAAGGGCVVFGKFNGEELSSFINFLSPFSIFCSEENAQKIKTPEYKKTKVTVLKTTATAKKKQNLIDLKSDKAYSIFSGVDGFYLPPYEYFAVDYCRRKNRNALVAKMIKPTAAAMALLCEDCAFICGVVSKEKGQGSAVLQGLLAEMGAKTVFAAAKEENIPFYIKNNFSPQENAVYFTK